jgi:hypothetical protein
MIHYLTISDISWLSISKTITAAKNLVLAERAKITKELRKRVYNISFFLCRLDKELWFSPRVYPW